MGIYSVNPLIYFPLNPGLDGAMAYAMVRKFKPRRIIEVGSGHSTRFMAQAIEDAQLETELHWIDPQPRREIDEICSKITRPQW